MGSPLGCLLGFFFSHTGLYRRLSSDYCRESQADHEFFFAQT